MMKISLKLTHRQLNTLVHHFGILDTPPIKDRNAKVARSVLNKVVIRFKKKKIDVDSNQTLFSPKGKQISFPLEYYEAHYLETFCQICDAFPMSEYDRNALQSIVRHLNQQLA